MKNKNCPKTTQSSDSKSTETKNGLARRSVLTGLLGAAGAYALASCDEQYASPLNDVPRSNFDDPITEIAGCSIIFSSIADLVGYQSPDDGMYAQVEGYYVDNDGGGGLFYFDASSTETDDRGTVIESQNGNGRWLRVFDGLRVNVRWFGACGLLDIGVEECKEGIASPLSSDYLGVQAALNWAKTEGGVVDVPGGTYFINRMLKIYGYTTLEMDDTAILKRFHQFSCGNPSDKDSWACSSLLAATAGAERVTIRGGTLDGNGSAQGCGAVHCNLFGGSSLKNLLIENVNFYDVVDHHAIDISKSEDVIIRGCNFLGHKITDSNNVGLQKKESIQIDPFWKKKPDPDNPGEKINDLEKGGFPNKRVLIEGCYFGPHPETGLEAPRCGVGNHAAFPLERSMHEDITIINNVFDDCGYAGVSVIDFNNTIIAHNTFNRCDIGIRSESNRWGLPQSSSGLVVDSNEFNLCKSRGIKFINDWSDKDDDVKFDKIVISNNIMNGNLTTLPYAVFVDLVWCSNVSISGNDVTDARNFVRSKYSDNVTIATNQCWSSSSNTIWLYEDSPGPQGQGFSNNIVISGNTFQNWLAHRCIHINSAHEDVSVLNNIMSIIPIGGGGSLSPCAIQADNGAVNITISGNEITSDYDVWDGRGIYISGGVTGAYIYNNGSYGGYTINSDSNRIDVCTYRLPNGNFAGPNGYC